MKLRTEIISIDHEELVNFLSTATYGDNVLSVEIPEQFESLKEKGPGDCWEDHLANVLLNGGYIDVYDNESYDEDCHSIDDANPYGDTPAEWDDDNSCLVYHLDLKTIIAVFNNILSAEIDADDSDSQYLRKCFNATFVDETGDFWDAWALLQAATFGEVVYG